MTYETCLVFMLFRGGLAIGRTWRIPGGLAANLARYPIFLFFMLLFLPAECILKLVFLAGNAIRLAHAPRIRQKDVRLENGVEAPRGVFQKAGYVTYLGMFEYKRAENLSFRFQNRRLLSGYVSNHSNLLSEDNLLQSRFCSRVSSLQSHQRMCDLLTRLQWA